MPSEIDHPGEAGPRRIRAGKTVSKRILFIHNLLTRFVQIDRDLLAGEHHVTERCETSPFRLRPWQIRRAVAEHDLVFAWFASWHSLPAVLWARRLGKPSVVVTGGYDTANLPVAGYGSQRGGIRRFVSRTVIHSATHLITSSESARRETIVNAGADPNRITVMYQGVEPVPTALPNFSLPPFGGGRREGRERLVLTVGNVWRENLLRKGLLPFVQAAAHLPDVRFIHVGKWCDDGIDELRRIAGANVEFHGFLPDEELFRLYERASVYVQASLHEGFGLSVAEAMSAGCIPVVTRAGALPEVVGDTGVFADSADPLDLARAIRSALDFGDERRHAARARVLEEFPMRRRQAALLDLIHTLTDAATPKSSGSEPRTQRSGVSGRPALPLTPLRCVRGSDNSSSLPFVSVLIPVRNEGRSIAACLDGILAQDYPRDRMEVIVADGMSTDETRDILASYAARDGRIHVIDNPCGIVSTGLNATVARAAGEVILRMDAHTEYASDYIRQCVAVLGETSADNVGGPWIAQGEGYVGRAIAVSFQSPFAVGGARGHDPHHEGPVDTVYLGCWPRDLFARIGNFDEELTRNQDDEFNLRLTRAGGKIWQSPRIRSWYRPRGSLTALFRQYAQYGYWKVRVIRKHKLPASVRHLVPALFVSALVVLTLAAPFCQAALWLGAALLSCYLSAVVAASVLTCRKAGWDLLPILPAVFACYHFGYGYGFLRGLADCLMRKNRPAAAFTKLTRPVGVKSGEGANGRRQPAADTLPAG
jgi:glycosyltransferase involved in cell wall biosynthesis